MIQHQAHKNSNQAERTTENDPIAIIGLSCRFPKAANPQSFWELLQNGMNGITEVPPERWDVEQFYDPDVTVPGTINTRWGGFIEGVDLFDPQFFGISPYEAERMDPQQRLLLEVTWETLENAGLSPEKLAGSQTGVFIGISSSDYSQILQFADLAPTDFYTGLGNSHSIAANRISYLLNFCGPSLAVDTACSSSLSAVHLACQSLRTGECDLALAGGVHLILSPLLSIYASNGRISSPQGRCKTFDADADGYVRGEGCGIVALKRLSDALRDGDNILALLRGSAINQDGRSNGMTAPNGLAQQAVIRQALKNAGVAPSQISYFEAHGTGTVLGDPIEVQALITVLGQERSHDRLCGLGSVKTNIGHLEAAAGIASLIKVVLSLQHEQIPPNLNFKKLNQRLSLEGTPFFIPTESHPWSRGQERRFASISSFGFGGTNAHVVLEEAPLATPRTKSVERPLHVLTLSAKSEKALQDLANNYAKFLLNYPTASLEDVCFTTNTGRSHFSHRLAMTADSLETLYKGLTTFVASDEGANLCKGQVQGWQQPKIAFLFTGEGSQYLNMGRQLYNSQPTFRKILEQCDDLLRSYLTKPLLSVLYPEPDAPSLLQKTAYTQPALFALEYALAELWRSWGILPDVVMGHNVGEYVAACVAGAFSLEDGIKLIAERGRLIQSLPQRGEMAIILADQNQVLTTLKPYLGRISLAAVNGSENTIISGDSEAIRAALLNFESEGVETHLMRVSHAFHSPLMDPILDSFEQVANQIQFEALQIPMVSSLTGEILQPGANVDPAYWRRHLREPVQFSQGMQALAEQEYELFIEIGPTATLLEIGKHCLPNTSNTWLPSLKKGLDDWSVLLNSLNALYVKAVDVDWVGFGRDFIRCKMALPTYPFQRESYWIGEKPPLWQDNQLFKRKTRVTTEPKQVQDKPLDLGRKIDQIQTQPTNDTTSSDPILVSQESMSFENFKDWLYNIQWEPKPRVQLEQTEETLSSAQRGSWLIFTDSTGVGQALSTLLQANGATCILVSQSEVYSVLKPGHYQINPARLEDFQQLLKDAVTSFQLPCHNIVYLWGLDTVSPESLTITSLKAAPDLGGVHVVHLVQALLKASWSELPRLWLVTRGVQTLGGETGNISIAQSPLLGLGRVIANEHPELRCTRVDLSPFDSSEEFQELFDELWLSDFENEIALRNRTRYVSRLVRCLSDGDTFENKAPVEPISKTGATLQDIAETPMTFNPNATYLITGGLGGLGLLIAQWMVEQGARNLVLMARSGVSAAIENNLNIMRKTGVQVVVAQADVTSQEQVSQVLAEIDRSMPTLKGVIHAAGVLEDGILLHLNQERFNAAMLPKVVGAWNLHTQTLDKSLDFFVLFSSIASVLGSPGQGNYAAANAFLDTLAHYRQAQNLPALSINWGPWAQVGLAVKSNQAKRLTLRGFESIQPRQGLKILDKLLLHNITQLGVIQIDWQQWFEFYPELKKVPLFSNLVVSDKNNDTLQQINLQEAKTEEVEQVISSIWESVLHLKTLSVHDNFFDFGGDSLFVLEVIRKLRIIFNRDISTPEIFQYPTIKSLAEYLTRDKCESVTSQIGSNRADIRRSSIELQQQFIKRRRAAKERKGV